MTNGVRPVISSCFWSCFRVSNRNTKIQSSTIHNLSWTTFIASTHQSPHYSTMTIVTIDRAPLQTKKKLVSKAVVFQTKYVLNEPNSEVLPLQDSNALQGTNSRRRYQRRGSKVPSMFLALEALQWNDTELDEKLQDLLKKHRLTAKMSSLLQE